MGPASYRSRCLRAGCRRDRCVRFPGSPRSGTSRACCCPDRTDELESGISAPTPNPACPSRSHPWQTSSGRRRPAGRLKQDFKTCRRRLLAECREKRCSFQMNWTMSRAFRGISSNGRLLQQEKRSQPGLEGADIVVPNGWNAPKFHRRRGGRSVDRRSTRTPKPVDGRRCFFPLRRSQKNQSPVPPDDPPA